MCNPEAKGCQFCHGICCADCWRGCKPHEAIPAPATGARLRTANARATMLTLLDVDNDLPREDAVLYFLHY